MMSDRTTILITDDRPGLAHRLQSLMKKAKPRILFEKTVGSAVDLLDHDRADVLLVTSRSVRGTSADDLHLLEILNNRFLNLQILFLAEPADIRTAFSAVRAGTYQYSTLPISDEELVLLVETALANIPGKDEASPAGDESLVEEPNIVGNSPQIREVMKQINLAAETDIPVLLTGETGTGKDLVAQAIHARSSRRDGPFIPIHLGALPPELVASELFGHEKGSFTGAMKRRIGQFELGNGGTIFLDEISTIDNKVQVSLLRLLEQKTFARLGGRKNISTSVRIVAASNQDLEEAVRIGAFREDLYHRLNVLNLTLPPLRDRQGDIPVLIKYFMSMYNERFDKDIKGMDPECFGLIEAHDWSGNVRELKNIIQRAVLLCDEQVLSANHLPPRLRPDGSQKQSPAVFRVGATLEEVEREMIIRTLRAVNQNKKLAAEILGISRRSLYDRLRRYGIDLA